MDNKNGKLAVETVIVFEIILIVKAVISIVSGQWKVLFLSLLTIISLILPFVIAYIFDIKKILLPPSFKLIMPVYIFLAQYLGEINKFYTTFWWWDLFLHGIFGSYAVITALYLMHGIIERGKQISERRFRFFTALFAFSFSIALGTLWEVFEFTGDYLFKTQMVKGGLEDTATDLIAKIVTAFITALIYYYRSMKNNRDRNIKQV